MNRTFRKVLVNILKVISKDQSQIYKALKYKARKADKERVLIGKQIVYYIRKATLKK